MPWWRRFAASSWEHRFAMAGAMGALLLAGIFLIRYPGVKQDQVPTLPDLRIALNLPLLEDMAVVSNLDLLEDFDTIENLPDLMHDKTTN